MDFLEAIAMLSRKLGDRPSQTVMRCNDGAGRAISQSDTPCAGFTLMEVNIALLVIAVGLSSMLALFPVGLRESNTATAETIQSAAASYIFARLHDNADNGNWHKDQPKTFIAKGFTADGKSHLLSGDDAKAFEGSPVRYQLKIEEVPNYDGFLYYAQLRVSDRKNGDMTREPVYYTEFIRKGDF